MPDRCAVYGCPNEAKLEKGISLHRIPFLNDKRKEAKKRTKRWVDFVQRKRDKWVPTRNSAVCSRHFTAESFEKRFSGFADLEMKCQKRLVRDEFGISAYPTIFEVGSQSQAPESSAREARIVSTVSLYTAKINVITSPIISVV